MDNDDQQIGRILSRREVLAIWGTVGAGLLAGCGPEQTESTGATSTASALAETPAAAGPTLDTSAAATPELNTEAATAAAIESNPSAAASQEAEVATAEAANTAIAEAAATAVPACVVRPEVTEGPYYVDLDLIRSDIRPDTTSGAAKAGTPLVLTFNVTQVGENGCAPLQGATVEIWHCDAEGQYSGVSDRSFNTQDENWLRGGQVTDANGVATFTTIYPGWYSGRAVHIHFKVLPDENKVFTSQLFFDDALSQQVFTQEPYAAKGSQDVLNSTDNIYQDLLLLTTTQTDGGYAATFDIGIDVSTLGAGQGGGRPGAPPPRS